MKKQKLDIEKPKEIRIITGSAKNKKLKAPAIEGFRAVQEVAKASLFSILGEKIVGATCLDLFAGSGNLGLEALSRGAQWCDFVDEEPESTKAIEENIVKCGFFEKSTVIRKDAGKYVASTDRDYDVILLDPFYSNTNLKHLFSQLATILKNGGKIFYFHAKDLNPQELIDGSGLYIKDSRKFGSSVFETIEKSL